MMRPGSNHEKKAMIRITNQSDDHAIDMHVLELLDGRHRCVPPHERVDLLPILCGSLNPAPKSGLLGQSVGARDDLE
jgi:hypothetical protein